MKIVASDDFGWGAADDALRDPAFANAVVRGRQPLRLRIPQRADQLPELGQRGELRQDAVGQRERLRRLQRRRAGAGPRHQPRLHRREDDRLPQLAGHRRDHPEHPLGHHGRGGGAAALVRLLLDRQERLGHGPHHPVHRARMAVPGQLHRLPRRQPQQRQLRLAEVARTTATTAPSSRRWTPARPRTSRSPSPADCRPGPCTCGPPTSGRATRPTTSSGAATSPRRTGRSR